MDDSKQRSVGQLLLFQETSLIFKCTKEITMQMNHVDQCALELFRVT